MQEISFKQMIKILVPKFKILVLLVIIGAICGGSVGAARTYSGRYFGTTIEFYVNPKRSDDATANNSQYGVYGAYGQHVMDNIIKLLKSESFAEQMLLDDNGLPIETVLAKEEDRSAIDEKIATAISFIGKADVAKTDLEASTEDLADKKLAYDEAKALASKAYSNYHSLVSAENATEEEREKARQEHAQAVVDEALAKTEYEAALQNEMDKKDDCQKSQELAIEKVDEVLELWRETEVYKDYIEILTKSISYSYYKEGELKTGSSTEALAKSFIYVNIKVSRNSEIANFVYDRVGEVLPKYVKANMAVPSGYVGTNCVRITRLDNIREAESATILTSAAKFAIVGGVFAGAVAAFAIVAFKIGGSWCRSIKNELAEESAEKKSKEETSN